LESFTGSKPRHVVSGVKTAGSSLQGNLLFKTCFERRSFGPAECGRVPLDPPYKNTYLAVGVFIWSKS